MTIEEIQNAFQKAGYQWQEHIYNDGLPECSIKFAKDTSPHCFTPGNNLLGDFGWGRFSRRHAWLQAYEWLQKKAA